MLFLVSSAAIRSTSCRIRIARKVMSSRFPIGVAHKYNFPAILIPLCQIFSGNFLSISKLLQILSPSVLFNNDVLERVCTGFYLPSPYNSRISFVYTPGVSYTISGFSTVILGFPPFIASISTIFGSLSTNGYTSCILFGSR